MLLERLDSNRFGGSRKRCQLTMMSLIRKTNMKIIATGGYIDSNNIGKKMTPKDMSHDIES